MLFNQRFLPTALALCAVALSALATNIFADELQTFAGKDATGKETTFYALQLNPQQLAEKAPAKEPASRQIAVVVDTSASQFGEHRRVSLATVRDALANLKPTDQVQLFASDTNAVAMTPLPVAPNSAEMQTALAKLEGRVPLGATDMRKTVDKVAASFSPRGDAPKSILYIGEGTSRAKLMNTKSFENALKKLSDNKISFNSMAIGPRLDLRVLGSFAAHTGGVMMRDTGRENSYGKELASTADATVYWPTAPPAPTAGTTVAENFMPPLRSDRNAVLVGTCTDDKATVEGTFTAPDGTEIKATFTATAKPETTNYYLKELVDEVTFNGGLTVPLFDTSSLNAAKESISAKADAIENKARRAFLQKDLQTAKMLANKALEIDDRQAAAREILDKINEANGIEIIDNSTAPAAGAGGGVMADGGLDMMGGPDMLGNEERARQIDAQVIQTDVTNRLNEARGLMQSDPEDAIQKLRDTQEFIRANQGHLSPEVRNQLYNNTESTLKAAQRSKARVDRNMQELQERRAARTEQQQLLKKLTRDEERVEQLSRTFDSLMREGKYTAAETGPAAELAGMLPESPLPRVATLTSRTASYHYANQQLKVQRQRAVVRTLMQVEKSHIPFPDEPPIVYPDSERWEQISESREKYKDMDLSGRQANENETRIKEALDDDTEMEYEGTELSEVVQDLKDKHGIEIVIDKGKVEDFTPITMNLKGVSLRSALKLMLKEADATYVIRDEVLLITTDEEANKELTTKVYPVADLVIPIETPDFQGGFGGMGGIGNGLSGGGGGGSGGALGGMGAGGGMDMLGGGGMGAGGGWSIIDAKAETAELTKPAAQSTPKAGDNRTRINRIPIEKLPQNVHAFRSWNSFFKTYNPTDAAIQGALAELQKAKKHDHVISLLCAQIAHSRPDTQKEMEEIQKRVDASFEKDRKKILSSPGPWSPAEKKQIDQLLLKLKERQDDEKLHTGLRVAIRALRAEKKNGEIAKLIQSCLIHAKPKPWMYQALAIALMLNDAPKEEVERAFVSALDFADSPQDLYMMGAMLGELGFEERALTVFKDLTELLPFVNKPYSMALTIAERSKSWKDKIWISERIMGKDWTSDNARIAKRGYFAAKGVKLQLQQELTKAAAELKKLSSKKEGEISAEAFTAAFQRVNELRHEIKMFDERMRQASFRDCIIRVSWTGDADIDLVVEEPPGTVCSADHPITQAGGVFSGNDYAFVERGHTECEETYSCAKGFPGTYRFAIYRRWGRPTEDKVIVETILNKGQQMKDPETGKMVSAEKRIKRVVLLKENTTKVEGEVVQGNSAGAIGEIALANGRRKDKISDFQLANAEQRMRLLPHLIGQKLAKVDNKYVQEGLADSGYNRNDRNLRNFNPLNPLAGGNSVGYQPVIVVLPTGANLQANAVISADRKYVRISCVPIFSHISSVTTFNLGTGETTISDPPPITPAPPPPGMNPGDGGAGGGGAGGGIDTQAAINSLNAQIAMLQAQIAALDPVQDAVLIATLQNTIAELQNTVTLLGG